VLHLFTKVAFLNRLCSTQKRCHNLLCQIRNKICKGLQCKLTLICQCLTDNLFGYFPWTIFSKWVPCIFCIFNVVKNVSASLLKLSFTVSHKQNFVTNADDFLLARIFFFHFLFLFFFSLYFSPNCGSCWLTIQGLPLMERGAGIKTVLTTKLCLCGFWLVFETGR
jgi:hypothetical protein